MYYSWVNLLYREEMKWWGSGEQQTIIAITLKPRLLKSTVFIDRLNYVATLTFHEKSYKRTT